MFQNLKKSGKKGFTLAELLIVVAIIAVLTAIAVPLFVGSLNKAEQSVKDANIRAVRSVAVVAILNIDKPADYATNVYEKYNPATGKVDETSGTAYRLREKICVSAKVSSTGDVTDITYEAPNTFTADSATKNDDGSYSVQVVLSSSEIKGENASGD